jgi:hypothetical protein
MKRWKAIQIAGTAHKLLASADSYEHLLGEVIAIGARDSTFLTQITQRPEMKIEISFGEVTK